MCFFRSTAHVFERKVSFSARRVPKFENGKIKEQRNRLQTILKRSI